MSTEYFPGLAATDEKWLCLKSPRPLRERIKVRGHKQFFNRNIFLLRHTNLSHIGFTLTLTLSPRGREDYLVSFSICKEPTDSGISLLNYYFLHLIVLPRIYKSTVLSVECFLNLTSKRPQVGKPGLWWPIIIFLGFLHPAS